MHIIEDRTLPSELSVLVEAEALIREARRLRRRRWAIGLSLVIVAAAAGAGYGLTSHGIHSNLPPVPPRATTSEQSQTNMLPTGPSVKMDVAGSLAVGPRGVLYIAAPDQHRILVRLADGKFKVVAGTGTGGYSGNGEKAVDAQLSDPADLTFDATGDLYFVDSGRVRVVKSDGVIVTVAGDGSTTWPPGSNPVATVAQDSPALDASFRSDPSIAFGPGGVLYISSDTQLLRMTHGGKLDVIQMHNASFGKTATMRNTPDLNLHTLAVAKDGGIYISGFNGWTIWHIAPNGLATYVGYDRGSGGTFPDLVEGPGGSVYAADGGAIMRVTPTSLVPVNKLVKVDGKYFWATNFAYGLNGTLYVDELPGNLGFEPRQQLVAVRQSGSEVLWTESESSAARHSQ